MVPKSTCLVLSVTEVTEGWICSMTDVASSIWGVTSSEMPEKNDVSVKVGRVVLPAVPFVAAVVDPPDTLVTK